MIGSGVNSVDDARRRPPPGFFLQFSPLLGSWFNMFANTGNLGRNGVKRARLDPLNPSNQQKGSHKSLLERLNSAGGEKTNAPASVCPDKPRYIDVTAAFFGKQRRPAQESKGQMLPPSPQPPRPIEQQQPSRPQRQETNKHDKQRRPVINELPVAQELRDELAGAIIFSYPSCVPAPNH